MRLITALARSATIAGLYGVVAVEAAAQDLHVAHDPRIELLSIVFRLADAEEYRACAFPRHEDAIETWFARHRDHRAIQLAREVRDKAGIGFDALPSLAIHLEPLPSLRLRD
jgi:hypothetical protein